MPDKYQDRKKSYSRQESNIKMTDHRTLFVVCFVFILLLLILFFVSIGLGVGTTYRDPRMFFFSGSEWLGREVHFVSVSEDRCLTSDEQGNLTFEVQKSEGSRWMYIYSVEDPSRVGFYNMLYGGYLCVGKYGPDELLVLDKLPFNASCVFVVQNDNGNITLHPAANEDQDTALFLTAAGDQLKLEIYSDLDSDFFLTRVKYFCERN